MRDGERRQETDRVAIDAAAQDQEATFEAFRHQRLDAGRVGFVAAALSDELEGAHGAQGPDIAHRHALVPGFDRLQALEHDLALLLRLFEQLVLPVFKDLNSC